MANDLKIFSQYAASGLSRVEPNAAAGSLRDPLQQFPAGLFQIDKFFIDDSANAMPGPEKLFDVPAFLDALDDADEGLIDDRVGPPDCPTTALPFNWCS